MDSDKFKIYTLNDEEVRYVGQTINPDQRYREHLSLNTYGCAAKDDWIRDRLGRGLTIQMNTIDSATTKDEANKLEAYWICYYHISGMELFNADVYHARKRNDRNLNTRLLLRASAAKNRPVLSLPTPNIESVVEETVVITGNRIEQATLIEAKRLVDKVALGLRNGYDAEICAITLEQVSRILSDS